MTNGGVMPNKELTDPQWRAFIVQRLDDGDRRMSAIEEGQKRVGAEVKKNTELTENALRVAKHTEHKVDNLILDTHRIADERHRENLAQIEAAARNALDAKNSAEKTQTDVAGLLSIYNGGKTSVKIVKGFAVGIKGIILYAACAIGGIAFIVACIAYIAGKGAFPPLFGH